MCCRNAFAVNSNVTMRSRRRALARDRDGRQAAHRRLRLAARRAKRREVVLAEPGSSQPPSSRRSRASCRSHQARRAQQRGPSGLLKDRVAVAAAHGRAARVEVGRNFAHPPNRDVGRQVRVDAEQPLARRPRDARVEVRDLLQRVNAGIGASRAVHADRRRRRRSSRPRRACLRRCAPSAGSASR